MTETNRIELKRELTDELDIEKEVIAFLNNREGGIIYVGIDKDGSVVGVKDIDGDMLKIKDRIRKNISPSPMGLFDVLAENIDGIDVIKIFLASGSEKPYYKTKYGMSTRGCYIRVGTAAEPMTTDMIENLAERFYRYGRMGMHVGDYDDGTPYMMEPGDDGMVRAEVKTNAFKLYLGLGYGGRLLKDNDKFHIAVDLGAMFWGGSPRIITHEGVDLAKDVSNISGKVGDYVSLAKSFKVFPVLDVRFVYNIF